jgi:hypothetical protein
MIVVPDGIDSCAEPITQLAKASRRERKLRRPATSLVLVTMGRMRSCVTRRLFSLLPPHSRLRIARDAR